MRKYEWDADEYKKFSSGQERWARELLSKLDLKGNESVLDLGCGDGRITAEIAKTVINGSVVGIDNSESMISLAKEKFPEEKYKNISFQVMDAKDIKFIGKFDVVFSNAALHWVDDHRKVMEGIHRCLKPGGRFLIQTGGRGNAAAAFETLGEMAVSDKWKTYINNIVSPFHFFSDKDYEELIPAAGFNPIRIELLNKDMVHKGIDGFKGFIRTTWLPFTQKIPEDKREQFISEAASLYVKKYPIDKEGNVHIGMVRLEAEAVKI